MLVLGEYIWQREVIPPADQWAWAIETCRILGDYADRKNVDIALELEPFRLSLLNNIDEMVRFIDECAHPRVRANIDVSHLVLSDCGPDSVQRLKDKAIHVHISDCDGKVHGDLPPGRGIVKFTPICRPSRSWRWMEQSPSNWNIHPIPPASSNGWKRPIGKPTA